MNPSTELKTTALFIDTTPFFGPLMQVHSRVMKHLDRSRYRIVLAGVESGDYGAFQAEAPDVKIVRFGNQNEASLQGVFSKLAKPLRILGKVSNYFQLGLLARREHASIVHVGMTGGMLVAGNIVALMSGARLVVHVHADPFHFKRSKRTVYRMGMKRADAVITVSSFIKERIVRLGIPDGKVHAVLNSVDLDRFNPGNDGSAIRKEYGIPQDAPLVLCLGRLFPGKGQHYLLRAMAKLSDAFPGARTLIVGWEDKRSGGAQFREQLESIIRDAGFEGRAIVAPPRPEAPAMMAAADVVAVPSSNDPCPLTVLEAMATGKPVVGFRSGGIPEELGDEDSVLVEMGDVDGLAEALSRLLQDTDLRHAVGQRNRLRAEARYYESRLAEDVDEVYAGILHRRSPSAEPTPDASTGRLPR